jgi:hypothetical protein
MLARSPKTAKQRKEQRRIRNRRWLREHRDRENAGLGLAHVVYDGDVLNLLVRRGYLTDTQVVDKNFVNAALSKFLADQTREKRF